MKGYKGFHKGMICRGKQYTENTVFEEPEANICKNGMHFCENPFDVLDYYDFIDDNGEFNEFAEVEALDEVKTDDYQKYCTKKLKIGAKLSLIGFVKACVDFVIEKRTVAQAIDAIASTGDYSKVASTGDYSAAASTGNYSEVTFTGNYSTVASTGNYFKAASTGECCIICCAGIGSHAKAKKGNWITLAEWEWDKEKGRYVPVCVKTEQVDGERIKEDVLYTLKDGEFQEVKP